MELVQYERRAKQHAKEVTRKWYSGAKQDSKKQRSSSLQTNVGKYATINKTTSIVKSKDSKSIRNQELKIKESNQQYQ